MMIGSMVLFFPPSRFNAGFSQRDQRRFSRKFSLIKAYVGPSPLFSSKYSVAFETPPYARDVTYTEEGHKMSWRMMLRSCRVPKFF